MPKNPFLFPGTGSLFFVRYTKEQKERTAKPSGMMQQVKDTAGLGTLFWLVGYLASLVLFFTPVAGMMGWILIAVFTPVTIAVAWWWFRARDLPLSYYAKVGIAWMAIAVVLDYLFIVLLFSPEYYSPHVVLYYTITLLLPVGVGFAINRNKPDQNPA